MIKKSLSLKPFSFFSTHCMFNDEGGGLRQFTIFKFSVSSKSLYALIRQPILKWKGSPLVCKDIVVYKRSGTL